MPTCVWTKRFEENTFERVGRSCINFSVNLHGMCSTSFFSSYHTHTHTHTHTPTQTLFTGKPLRPADGSVPSSGPRFRFSMLWSVIKDDWFLLLLAVGAAVAVAVVSVQIPALLGKVRMRDVGSVSMCVCVCVCVCVFWGCRWKKGWQSFCQDKELFCWWKV